MREIRFEKATGVIARVDFLGNIYHEQLGTSVLSFSSDCISFSQMKLPYRSIELPKAHFDKGLFQDWLRLSVVFEDAQYFFGFRAEIEQMKEIPIPFAIRTRRAEKRSAFRRMMAQWPRGGGFASGFVDEHNVTVDANILRLLSQSSMAEGAALFPTIRTQSTSSDRRLRVDHGRLQSN